VTATLVTATVGAVERALAAPTTAFLDVESREWLRSLRAVGAERDDAVARLHALLLKAARFEMRRRRGEGLDELAVEAADDALLGVLRRLDDFRGASRFTTWAYKFALYEAAVKVRKRSWQGREVLLEAEGWQPFADTGLGPDAEVEQRELFETVREAIDSVLTPHQRQVLIALAVNGVPIDVLAERLGSNRGALYKTLHDARRRLRDHLGERGLAFANVEEK
jgi:RNA polymerase sigma-70 factor (ECF subfamily)